MEAKHLKQPFSLSAGNHSDNVLDKLLKYEIRNAVRNKWTIVYGLFFFILSEGLFRFSGAPEKVFVSLMSAMIVIVPLVSIMFSVMHVYNGREFTEMLLSQPINRTTVFFSSFLSAFVPLAACFCICAGAPLLFHSFGNPAFVQRSVLLIVNGFLLTGTFCAVAFAVATAIDERAKGFGMALTAWFFAAVIYDGIFLFLLYALHDYPTEGLAVAMTFLNPVDLSRISLSLALDQSAMMGYTGAVYKKLLGSWEGIALSLSALSVWALTPIYIARRSFLKKDF